MRKSRDGPGRDDADYGISVDVEVPQTDQRVQAAGRPRVSIRCATTM
jgi:hypothetical protein